ncbi:MAG: hypothetical protein ACK4XK_09460, partial [Casimicrobiaceae bacterium]
IVAALSLYLGIQRPYYNWDLIGYIAAVKSFDTADAAEIHVFTFESVRRAVPDKAYSELTETDHYRRTIAKDASALKEHLPFYQIRPVYNGLILAMHRLGMDMVVATNLISALSVVLALAVLWRFAYRSLPPLWTAAIPLLSVIFGVIDLARLSTPDALAFLFTITVAWLYWTGRHTLLFFALPFLVATRTDFILFALPLLLAVFVLDRPNRFGAIASTLACIAVYQAIVTYWAHPGWAKIVYFTLIQILTHPLSTPTQVTAAQYLAVLGRGLYGLIQTKSFLLYLIFAVYPVITLAKERHSMLDGSTEAVLSLSLTLVCLVFVILHFLLFPVMWDRFFSGSYLVGCVATLALIAWRSSALRSSA